MMGDVWCGLFYVVFVVIGVWVVFVFISWFVLCSVVCIVFGVNGGV